MASADECFACLSALLEDGPAEGIEQRARAWEPALKATIRWIRDPSTYSKGQIVAIPTAGFPPPLLACCMLHGSQVPPLSAIFRHPPLHLRPCCMGLTARRFLPSSAIHTSAHRVLTPTIV